MSNIKTRPRPLRSPRNSVCLTAPANDLRAALKAGVLVNGQTGSFDITTNCGTGFQHTSVGSENVAVDCSMDNHRGRANLGPDMSVLTDCQYTGRLDSALHFAVNHQLTPESHIAFNRYSFGKHTFRSLSSCSKTTEEHRWKESEKASLRESQTWYA